MNSANSINPEELTLDQIKEYIPKHPVSDHLPRYEQPILYGGCKLSLQAPAVELTSLMYKTYAFGDSVIVPVTPWLRSHLNLIETFVTSFVTVPQQLMLQWPHKLLNYYKPIYEGKNLAITLSKWCRFTQTVNGKTSSVQPLSQLGPGRYSFVIDVPHVYIGPHKSGHLYSLNFRVSHIHFEPSVQAPITQAPMAQAPMAQAPVAQVSMPQIPMPQSMLSQATMSPQSPPTDIVSTKEPVSFPGMLPTRKERVKAVRGRRKHAIVGDSE